MDLRCDIAVIGGGPAGSMAALTAARAGLDVVLLERTRHPRFHVGESLLPQTLDMLRELGLQERLNQVPRTRKVGASLMFPEDAAPTDFYFRDGLLDGGGEAANLARAPFDAMLLEACRDAGARVLEETAVRGVEELCEGACLLRTEQGTVSAGQVIDASGQAALIARRRGLRRPVPGLDNVACYGHYLGVHRRGGELAGMPVFVMLREGWAWFIPLDEQATSVGLVMRAADARAAGVPTAEMLDWAIERCPALQRLMRSATPLNQRQGAADFSYACRPYCGPGFFLCGDAAMFLDPVFSTGVCLGLVTGRWAAESAAAVAMGSASPAAVRRRYTRRLADASRLYLRLVRQFYTQPFRDIFMQGAGPFQVHRAVLSALAGYVFPKPPWEVRWRLRLFELFVAMQRWRPIAPATEPWSLLEAKPARYPATQPLEEVTT